MHFDKKKRKKKNTIIYLDMKSEIKVPLLWIF